MFSMGPIIYTIRIDHQRDAVAIITLNRPDRLNAITWEMVDELHAALDDIDRDNACRVVVLTGEASASAW